MDGMLTVITIGVAINVLLNVIYLFLFKQLSDRITRLENYLFYNQPLKHKE